MALQHAIQRNGEKTLQHYENTRSSGTWRKESKLIRKEGRSRRDMAARRGYEGRKTPPVHIRLRWRLA